MEMLDALESKGLGDRGQPGKTRASMSSTAWGGCWLHSTHTTMRRKKPVKVFLT